MSKTAPITSGLFNVATSLTGAARGGSASSGMLINAAAATRGVLQNPSNNTGQQAQSGGLQGFVPPTTLNFSLTGS